MMRHFGGNPKTLLLVSLVAGLFLTSGHPGGPTVWVVLVWFTVCLGAEALWHRSRDEINVVTMAPAAYVSTLVILPGPWGLLVVLTAAFLGAAGWRRAGVQATAVYVLAVAAGSMLALAALAWVGFSPDLWPRGLTSVAPLGLTLAGITYHVIVQTVTSLVAAQKRDVGPWTAWREAYGYGTELVTTVALVLVALLGVFCYEALGFRGVLLCVMPLLFVRDGSRRYLELQRAQARIIHVERLAAKGEMAAEIGHELNNYLAAISGRSQLLELSPGTVADPALSGDVDRIRELSLKMAGLAKGLMDFSHRETKRSEFGVNELVERTVELVRPQARFRTVEFRIHADPRGPVVEMDPGQVQQALLTLFRSAVRGAKHGRSMFLDIRTEAEDRGVAIQILGGGGDAGGERTLVWKPEPAESTVGKIVARHHGRFESGRDDEGEGYRVYLPAA